ncbi:MAG: hypothetical protein K8S16_13960 [Bacteroidales bacterium]|nr:hypothetical protein [Bacteroidales bacterium]
MRKYIEFNQNPEEPYMPTDIMGFGKNKGLSLEEIYEYQPRYIEWLILNIEGFKINIDDFYSLPKPTTDTPRNEFLKFSKEWREQHKGALKRIIERPRARDLLEIDTSYDELTSVYEIKQYIKKGIKLYPINFRFGEEATKINNEKLK